MLRFRSVSQILVQSLQGQCDALVLLLTVLMLSGLKSSFIVLMLSGLKSSFIVLMEDPLDALVLTSMVLRFNFRLWLVFVLEND